MLIGVYELEFLDFYNKNFIFKTYTINGKVMRQCINPSFRTLCGIMRSNRLRPLYKIDGLWINNYILNKLYKFKTYTRSYRRYE